MEAPESIEQLLQRPDWVLYLPSQPSQGCVRLAYEWTNSAVYLPLRTHESLVHKPTKSAEQHAFLAAQLQAELQRFPNSLEKPCWSTLPPIDHRDKKDVFESPELELNPIHVLVKWAGSNSVLTVYQRTLLRSLSICSTWIPVSLLDKLTHRMPPPAPGFPVDELARVLNSRNVQPRTVPVDRLMLPPLPSSPSTWRWNTALIASSLSDLTLNNADLTAVALDGLTDFLVGNATLSSLNLSANSDLFKCPDTVARFGRAIGYSVLQRLQLNTLELAGRIESLESFLFNLHSRTLKELHLCNLGFEEQVEPVTLPEAWTQCLAAAHNAANPRQEQVSGEDLVLRVRAQLTIPSVYAAAVIAAFVRRSTTISADLALALQSPLTDPHAPQSGDSEMVENPAHDITPRMFAPFSSSGGMVPPGCPNLHSLNIQGNVWKRHGLSLLMASIAGYLEVEGFWKRFTDLTKQPTMDLKDRPMAPPTGYLPPTEKIASVNLSLRYWNDLGDTEQVDPDSVVDDAQLILCGTILARAYEPFYSYEKSIGGSSSAPFASVFRPALWAHGTEVLSGYTKGMARAYRYYVSGRKHPSRTSFDWASKTEMYQDLKVQQAATVLLSKARILGCRVTRADQEKFSLWLELPSDIRTRVLRWLDPPCVFNGWCFNHRLTRTQFRSVLAFATDRRTIGYTAEREAPLVDIRLQQESSALATDETLLDQPRFSFADAYILHGFPHYSIKDLNGVAQTLSSSCDSLTGHDPGHYSFLHLTGTNS